MPPSAREFGGVGSDEKGRKATDAWFHVFFGLEEWLEQEIQFPQWWFLNWDCTTEFMDI